MTRQPSGRKVSKFFGALSDWFGTPQSRRTVAPRSRKRSPLGFESLDGRLVLSATPGALISGTVFDDLTGGGNVADGPGQSGVTVNLYESTGGNTFLGAGNGNTLVGSTTTNGSGKYSFAVDTAATYFVQEVTPPNFAPPAAGNVATVVVSSADLNGVAGTPIDTFTTNQSVTATNVGGATTDATSVAASEALGGHRDLFAQLTTATGSVMLAANPFGTPLLEFDTSASATGNVYVAYDGNNSATPTVINPTGLGGVDLTQGGLVNGFTFTVGADHASSITINVFKDGSNESTVNVPFTATSGNAAESLFVPFSSFTTALGSGAGNFSSVGALQVSVDDSQAINGQILTIGTTEPTPLAATNFANLAQVDLSITKVDNSGGSSIAPSQGSVSPGQAFTYSILVTNNGPNAVTGATIADTFPTGLGNVSFTAVETGGATGFTASSSNATAIADTVNMPVGSTISYTVSVTANQNISGLLTNVATVTAPAGTSETNTANNTATDVDTLAPVADLKITKTDNVGGSSITNSEGTLIPGNGLVYTIVVTNSGPSNVTGATVTDLFPAGIGSDTFTAVETGGASGFSASGSGNINDTVNMPEGSTITYTVNATSTSSVTGTLSNTATVAVPAGTTDPTPANNTATDTDELTAQYDLAITKVDNVGGSSITATQGSLVSGGALTYTIVVTNNGPSDVRGATVTDPFPADITSDTFTAVESDGASGFSSTGSGAISDVVDMPAGSTITYTVNATTSPAATGILSNTATVGIGDSNGTDPNLANNTATDTDALIQQADLSITKVDNVGGSSITATQGTLIPGNALVYTIVVTNAGPSAVTGATVADTFPAGIASDTFTAVETGGATGFTASGSGNITDTVTMPVGSTITYTVTATSNSAVSGTLSNTATVTAPAGITDPTPANNTATDVDTLTPQADLKITKVDNVGGSSITSTTGTLVPGNTLVYTIVVTNSGPSAVTGATVADTFPTGVASDTFTAVATGSATGFTASGSGNISNTVTMPVGSTITYTVTAVSSTTATGTLSNTATVAAPSGTTDPTPANNTATDVDTLTPQADLKVTKVDNVGGSSITAAQGSIVAGNALTYTIVVTNAGPSSVTGATVTDTFPAGVASDTYTATATGGATGFTASGSGNISNTVTMPVGSTITYTVSATTSSTATGTLSNTATVAAPTGTTDPTPANNTAVDVDAIVASASVSGTMFIDLNKNGVQDSTEAGIAGVEVELLTSGTSTVAATTTTNTSGVYLFSNVTPGSYQVKFLLGNSPTYTLENQTGTPNSDVDPATATTAAFTVAASQNVVTSNNLTNAGVVPKLSKEFFLGR
jgi:uncharacterized repeat protein (TIGR01451 family)